MAFGNVKCPVHGEHGNLANGQCWYCVQAGKASVGPKPISKTSTVVGVKRKIA